MDNPEQDTEYEKLLHDVIYALINSKSGSEEEKALLDLMRIYAIRVRGGE